MSSKSDANRLANHNPPNHPRQHPSIINHSPYHHNPHAFAAENNQHPSKPHTWLGNLRFQHYCPDLHHSPPSQADPNPNPWVTVRHGGVEAPWLQMRPTIQLPTRVVRQVQGQCGQLMQLADGCSQILLEILVCPIGGENLVVKALVDTGAQINVVRRGLFPETDMRPAKDPLRLTLADGQPFWGGDREVNTRVTFGKNVNNVIVPWRARANFYEGDIKADMILCLPWLAQNGLDVLTREGCLGQRQGWRVFPIGSCPDVISDPPSDDEEDWIDTNLSSRVGCSGPHRKSRPSRPPPPPVQGPKPLSINSLEARQVRRKAAWELKKAHLEKEAESFMVACMQAYDDEALPPLELPVEVDELPEYLSEAEKWELVRRNMWPHKPSKNCSGIYVTTDGQIQSDLAKKLRQQLLSEYADTVFRPQIFSDPPERFPGGIHTIKLKEGVQPHYQHPFNLTGERRKAMEDIVQKWIDVGKIERPLRNEGWGAAVFPIPKKNGEYRGITDQRGLNERVQRDNYPLPLIEGILERKGRCRLFSKLDLKDAFSQVGLSPECRHLTTINTPLGPFQWKVLPQGYCNAPSFFQRVMDMIYFPVRDCIDNYIDDGIVGTNEGATEEEEILFHFQQLRRICEVLKENKLVLDPKKCEFFTRRVEFCGHVLENGTRRPAPGKLLAVERWPPPKTVTEVRAFLGFANYYSTYVRNFAKLAAPLMEKLKVGRIQGKKGSKHPVHLSESDLKAFNDLKEELVSGLSLQAVNPDAPFVLRVDASEKAIGAVLEQLPNANGPITPSQTLNGQTVPVAFMSRKLSPGQAKKWHVKEKEAYAIVMALRKWASWVGLQPLLILSDHKSLEEWAHEVLDSPTGPTGRQARWHMLLSHFNVTVGYVPGRDNGIADIMTRWAYPAADAVSDVSMHGTWEDDQKMEAIIKKEKAEEKECRVVNIVWPQGMLEEYQKSGKEVEILTGVRKPRVLDLFSGTGSFSRPFAKLGWEVYTLDHNPRFRPHMCCDILEWNPQEFPPGFFDVVLASPPCQYFSIANHHKPPGLHQGDCYVLQTLRIIEYLQPQVWLLENPRTGALPQRSYMAKIPFSDFDYCEFAEWGYKKPTRIWGSPQISQVKSVLCQGTCKNMAQAADGQRPRHKQWLGAYGHQPSQVEKYRVPEKLVEYLIQNLGELTLTHGSSSFPVDSSHATLQVLTRAGRDTANDEEDEEASEPEMLDGSPPPIHPPRSTKKTENGKWHSTP